MNLKFRNILATFVFLCISSGSIFAQSKVQTSAKIKINIKKSISPLVVKDNSIELNERFTYPNNNRREVLISIKSDRKKSKYSILPELQTKSSFLFTNYSWISDYNGNNIISRINNEDQFSEIARSLNKTYLKNTITIVY